MSRGIAPFFLNLITLCDHMLGSTVYCQMAQHAICWSLQCTVKWPSIPYAGLYSVLSNGRACHVLVSTVYCQMAQHAICWSLDVYMIPI